jgi:hypothetical protein
MAKTSGLGSYECCVTPNAGWIRIRVGLLFIASGIFSILPFLGVWMLPLGFLLMAYDVPFLRKPVRRFSIGAARRWGQLCSG